MDPKYSHKQTFELFYIRNNYKAIIVKRKQLDNFQTVINETRMSKTRFIFMLLITPRPREPRSEREEQGTTEGIVEVYDTSRDA